VTGAARRALGEFDTTKPNIARMNDYFLGGKDNFAADRRAAEELLAIAPEIKPMAEENRRFLGRAVRFLAEQGIRQFFDIGSGLPTRQNTHEVARTVCPSARVVYADNDPVVISHGEAILAGEENTAVVKGDILHPQDLVAQPGVRRVIDFDEPMAVLIFGAPSFHTRTTRSRASRGCAARSRQLPDPVPRRLRHQTGRRRPDRGHLPGDPEPARRDRRARAR
jgi:hypothetical protein